MGTMRDNVQNHIKGLNFKYRVNLREKNVTYLNKLGKFKDAHTLELTDKKGRISQITAARFIVAVGGRPTPLDCEGGELAISSDDIFALKTNPGKTLCVGASYISLECAGFLRGLGLDVTVAVRSILLRGFDRECADMIGDYMVSQGVKFKKQVVPSKLEKVEGDKIKVTFSDGSQDTYDTVLVAIGRSADTSKLGLENVNVATSSKNGKISTVLEQTSTPHIYAIGDVMEGCPELTPVAIQAGISLSRRLFGDPKNLWTTKRFVLPSLLLLNMVPLDTLKKKPTKLSVKIILKSTTKVLFPWNGLYREQDPIIVDLSRSLLIKLLTWCLECITWVPMPVKSCRVMALQ